MYVVTIILVIIVIVLIRAAFIPADFVIKRSIIINKTKQEVFDYIKLLKNQDHYSKWVMTDPAMQKHFTGVDGTVGFIYAWQSENKQVGQGEQEIIKLIDGECIDNEIRFLKPFNGISYTSMLTDAISDSQTEVKWLFKGKRKYLMKMMQLLCNMDKMLGKDMQISLNNLKTIIEK